MAVKEMLDSTQTLNDSLCIVHAIHTDTEQTGFDTEFGKYGRALPSDVAPFRQRRGGIGESHANRIGSHPCDVALPIDGEAVPLGQSFQSPVNRLKKIIAVRLDVKADEIGAQQAIEKIALPRTDAKDFRIRPRYMPKDCHAGVRAGFLHHAR